MKEIETLGTRLKKLRNSRNLRQDQLASLIGVDRSTVHHYENDSRQPSNEKLVRLASVFNVTTDELLGYEKKTMIDISGLTASEANMIRTLVVGMTRKNEMLKGLGIHDDSE